MHHPSADDLTIAAEALRTKDFGHALSHLGRVFVTSPGDERLEAMLETVAREVDILSLVPADDAASTALVRAWALRRAGQLSEAVTLLGDVVVAFPELGLETVLASWLVVASARRQTLSQQAMVAAMRMIGQLSEGALPVHRLLPGERSLMAGYGELARALVPFVVGTHDVLVPLLSSVLRRCGHLAEARAVVEPLAQKGDVPASVLLALALRADGEPVASAALFARLRVVKPDDRVFVAEEARSHFVAGDDARTLATLAGTRDPVPEDVAMLEACRRGDVTGDRVAFLDGLYRRFLIAPITMPHGGTSMMFASLRAEGANLKVHANIHGWDPPSLRWMSALVWGHGNQVAALDQYTVDAIEGVDALGSRRGAPLVLWERRGGVIVQAVPEPSEAVRVAVAKVAEAGASLEEVWTAAAGLAQSSEAPSRVELLAALVHAPSDASFVARLPEGLFRYQVAGACVIACSPGGWKEVGPVLEGLVFGPIDWVSAAALVALGELARRDAEAARPARQLLLEASGDLLDYPTEPRWGPLVGALSRLPAVPRAFLANLSAEHRRLWSLDKPEPPEASPAPVSPLDAELPLSRLQVMMGLTVALFVLIVAVLASNR